MNISPSRLGGYKAIPAFESQGHATQIEFASHHELVGVFRCSGRALPNLGSTHIVSCQTKPVRLASVVSFNTFQRQEKEGVNAEDKHTTNASQHTCHSCTTRGRLQIAIPAAASSNQEF